MFHELIYCGDDHADYEQLQVLIGAAFPAATLEGECDEIKGWRLSVTGEQEQDEFYRFAIKNRFAMQGLSFNLDLRMHTGRIKKLVDEASQR